MVLHMRDNVHGLARRRSAGEVVIELLEGRRMLAAGAGSTAFALSFGREDQRSDGNAVATDADGNVYVTGTYGETANVSGNARHPVMLRAVNKSNDIFVVKYSPAGKVIWARSFGGGESDVGSVIKVQGSDVYVGGTYKAVANFGGRKIASEGARDVFVAKLSAASGAVRWVDHLGGGDDDYINAIEADANNNVFISGTVRLAANIDPFGGKQVVKTRGVDDTFVEKLDATTGKLVWSKLYGESDTIESAESLVADGEGGVYVAGIFYRSVDFDREQPGFTLKSQGRRDIYFGHLGSDNQWQFLKDIGGGNRTTVGGIAAGPDGDLFMTGSFKDQVNFDPGRTNRSLNAIGKKDGFVARYTPSGGLVWVKQFGGDGQALARSIAVDAKGNVYATGDLLDEVSFNPRGKGGVLRTDKSGDALQVVEGPGTPPFAELQSDPSDTYIAKLTASGRFVYAKKIGGRDGSTQGNSIATGTGGGVYLTGAFFNRVTLSTGTGRRVTAKTVEDSDQTNVFLTKING